MKAVIEEYLNELALIEEGSAILRPILSDLLEAGAVDIDGADISAVRNFREYLASITETIRRK